MSLLPEPDDVLLVVFSSAWSWYAFPVAGYGLDGAPYVEPRGVEVRADERVPCLAIRRSMLVARADQRIRGRRLGVLRAGCVAHALGPLPRHDRQEFVMVDRPNAEPAPVEGATSGRRVSEPSSDMSPVPATTVALSDPVWDAFWRRLLELFEQVDTPHHGEGGRS